MRVTSVVISHTVQARPYEPVHLEVKVELDEGDNEDEVIDLYGDYVLKQVNVLKAKVNKGGGKPVEDY